MTTRRSAVKKVPAKKTAEKVPTPPSMLSAAQTGDIRIALERLRDELAVAIDFGPPGAVAQTAAQLRGTLADLEALGKDSGEVSKLDELTARREARLSTSDVPVRAAKKRVGGKRSD